MDPALMPEALLQHISSPYALPSSDYEGLTTLEPTRHVKQRIETLCQEDFYDLEEKTNTTFASSNFSDCAVLFICCASNPEMGEDYQDVLYKINPKSLDWIKRRDLDNLLRITPNIKKYLVDQWCRPRGNKVKLPKVRHPRE
jgi:hypothetical protein